MDSASELLMSFGISNKQIQEHESKTNAALEKATQEELLMLNKISSKKSLSDTEKEELKRLRTKILGS